MVDQTQNNNDFSSGFLIKDKDGKFKKIKDEKVDNSENQDIGKEFIKDVQPATSSNKTVAASQPLVSDQDKKQDKIEKNTFIPQPSHPVSNQAFFVGEPDEEEEIRNHQEELNKILATTPALNKTAGADDLSKELIRKFDLKFDNEILVKRFEKIIESGIKGIRSNIETEEVLHKQSKVGGMELSQELAKDIVKFVADHKKRQPEETKKVVEKTPVQPDLQSDNKVQSNLSQVPPDFIPLPKQKPQPVEEVEKKIEKIPTPITKSQKEIDKKKEFEPEKSTIPKTTQPSQPVEELYQKSSAEEMAKISHVRQQEKSRPQVIDIRQPSKVVGPVEELMQIDLKEFRRLGNNPAESAEKILEKIYLLEEESWQMRMDGIASWQKSPMHMLYVGIGQESLKTDKPVTEIISLRESSGQPVIHMEEFLAINKLNNKLVI